MIKKTELPKETIKAITDLGAPNWSNGNYWITVPDLSYEIIVKNINIFPDGYEINCKDHFISKEKHRELKMVDKLKYIEKINLDCIE